MNGLFTRAKLFVLAADEIAKFAGNRVAIDWGDGVLLVQLRNFFVEALAKFDKRIRDVLVDAVRLRRVVVAPKIDPHGPGVVEDLGETVSDIFLIDHFFNVAQAIGPVAIIISGDRALLGCFFRAIEEEGLASDLATCGHDAAAVVSAEIATTTTLAGVVIGHAALALLRFSRLLP